MITLKENQTNYLAFQKEDDTPFEENVAITGSVYNIILTETLSNDTGSSLITIGSWTNPQNPRWVTLQFDITSSTEYLTGKVNALAGTTYDLKVYYAPQGGQLVWGSTGTSWIDTNQIWAQTINIPSIEILGQLKYEDRVFVSGSVSPIQKSYISPNENGMFKVYQG